MRVLHTSDLHGKYKRLLGFEEAFDVWVDTGDFFDNLGRRPKTGYTIVSEMERRFQLRWWRLNSLGPRIASWLNGRPLVAVSGNHDFVSLGSLLRREGVEVIEVTPEGVHFEELRWAGFRQVPRELGEWVGETPLDELASRATTVRGASPDVLLTHARPDGVLDPPRCTHAGLPGLLDTSARWHFFRARARHRRTYRAGGGHDVCQWGLPSSCARAGGPVSDLAQSGSRSPPAGTWSATTGRASPTSSLQLRAACCSGLAQTPRAREPARKRSGARRGNAAQGGGHGTLSPSDSARRSGSPTGTGSATTRRLSPTSSLQLRVACCSGLAQTPRAREPARKRSVARRGNALQGRGGVQGGRNAPPFRQCPRSCERRTRVHRATVVQGGRNAALFRECQSRCERGPYVGGVSFRVDELEAP